jgi:serine/threonine protein kinase
MTPEDSLSRHDGIEDLPTLDGTDRTAAYLDTRPPREPHQGLTPGTFGPYLLIRPLGRGGFGEVWEAESVETGRRLALKVLTAARETSGEERERFRREGRLAASINHPHCVYVFAADEVDGFPVISMELMAGGTLHDKLAKRGTLPSREAVDDILDVIEGLEAAQAKGVIHRDVKPSNCFVDESGRVRIGDFGLSKTLDYDSQVTTEGTFLGTPAYSSPEQVKGREVDFRTDLYAVGATLYALLSGHPPFEGQKLAETLARILSEDPPPLSKWGVSVPKGLERVVMRLMAKPKEARYPSYADVRAALLPFSTRLTPASVRLRFAAWSVDSVVVAVLGFLFGFAVWLARSGAGTSVGAPQSLANHWPALTMEFLYFAILEGRWGQSLGKRLFGLRVTAATGSEMSPGRAALRTFAYLVLFALPMRIPFEWDGMRLETPRMEWSLVLAALSLALFATMRKSNGYAGPHELLSGTRVTLASQNRLEAPIGVSPDPSRAAASSTEESQAYGPYRVIGARWTTESEALLLARDTLLERDVWIHRCDDPSLAPAVMELSSPRASRLRWLQGTRVSGCWDAYEKPSGASLLESVRVKGRLPWSVVRRILNVVASELSLRGEASASRRPMTLRHVWVLSDGGAKVLSFEADPGAAAASAVDAFQQPRLFMQQLLILSLEGVLLEPSQLEKRLPKVPLPVHTDRIVGSICGLDGTVFSLQSLIDELARIQDEPAAVDVPRRAAAIGTLSPLPTIGVCVVAYLLVVPSEWSTYRGLLREWSQSGGESGVARKAAAGKLLSHTYSLVTTGLPAYFMGSTVARLPPEDRRAFEAARSLYPSPTERELTDAHQLLRRPPISKSFVGLLIGVLTLPVALLGVLSAIAFRGGAGLGLAGIAIRTADGRLASRWRCGLRAFVVFVPLLAPLILMQSMGSVRFYWLGVRTIGSTSGMVDSVNLGLLALGLLVFVLGSFYAIARPQAGLQDLIAKTRLVPR